MINIRAKYKPLSGFAGVGREGSMNRHPTSTIERIRKSVPKNLLWLKILVDLPLYFVFQSNMPEPSVKGIARVPTMNI